MRRNRRWSITWDDLRPGRRLRTGSLHRTLRIRRRQGVDRLGIASNEIASRHRIDFDATMMAMAQTAKDMNSKYKETSEAGLAQSVVLC